MNSKNRRSASLKTDEDLLIGGSVEYYVSVEYICELYLVGGLISVIYLPFIYNEVFIRVSPYG